MPKSLLMCLSLILLFFISSLPGHSQPTNPKVLMKTSKGDIIIELYPGRAPGTVKNFLSYVDEKFYDSTIFHRVIKDFMTQGGGYTANLAQKPTKPPIKNEAANGLKNQRGTIAMARTMELDSATSQFFINHVDNPSLDHRDNSIEGFGYCVFGKVIQGLEVVDAIASVRTMTRQGMQDVPRESVTIISVERLKEK